VAAHLILFLWIFFVIWCVVHHVVNQQLINGATGKGDGPLCVLLGKDESESSGGSSTTTWIFALDLTSIVEKEQVETIMAKQASSKIDGVTIRLENMRALLAIMQGNLHDLSLCGYGFARTTWHNNNKFCGACGSPTRPVEAGGSRKCTSCK